MTQVNASCASLFPRLRGGRLEWGGTDSADLVPTSTAQAVTVKESSDLYHLLSAGQLTVDFSQSGVGGLHNNFSTSPWTGYSVHACKNAVDQLALFAVPTGTTVDAALVADLEEGGTPGRYSCFSAPLGFVMLDGSEDIIPFVNRDGYVWFAIDDGMPVLSGGDELSPTAIDLSALIPEGSVSVLVKLRAAYSGAPADVVLYTNTPNWQYIRASIRNVGTGNTVQETSGLLCPLSSDLSDSLRYSASSSMPGGGLDVFVEAVKLFE